MTGVSMFLQSRENSDVWYNLATCERVLIDPEPESDGTHRVKIRYMWSKVTTYLSPEDTAMLKLFLGDS